MLIGLTGIFVNHTRKNVRKGMIDFEQYLEKKAENESHEVAELICLKCLDRAIHVYSEKTLLKHLQCKCGEVGYLIKTGQTLEEAEG